MRKGSVELVIGVVAILAVVGILLFSGFKWTLPGLMPEVWEGCTWEPDYCWASCVEFGSNEYTAGTPIMCPNTADVHQCKIKDIDFYSNVPESATVYQSCSQNGWFGSWVCESKVKTARSGDTIERGQWIAVDLSGGGGADVTLRIVRKALMSCGTAACTGGGELIVGAQGCSWNPGDVGYTWKDGSTGAKSIDFGSGFRYVCSQHLVSCPAFCEDPMLCSTPSNLKTVTVSYEGSQHPATCRRVGSTAQLDIYGCKPEQTCISSDPATGQCKDYGDKTYDGKTIGQCGVIAVDDAGECCQNSDCGSIGTYYCDWDSSKNKGACRPVEQDTDQECRYSYDCTQTGTGCRDRVLYGVKCVSGTCQYTEKDVGCCTIDDCPNGYFCNSDRQCQPAQQEQRECPFSCCDQRYNTDDLYYKQKACPLDVSVCCPDHSCKASRDLCGYVPGTEPPGSFDWNWIWIVVIGALLGLLGYAFGGSIGAAIGAITGGIIGYMIYWYLGLAWWQQLLLGIGGIAGGGIMLYLFGAAVVGFIVILAVALIKK